MGEGNKAMVGLHRFIQTELGKRDPARGDGVVENGSQSFRGGRERWKSRSKPIASPAKRDCLGE